MEIALLIVCAVLSALSLAVCVYLLVKKSPARDDALTQETLRRLEEKTDSIGRLADFNARTAENLSRNTEQRLQNMQNRLNEDIKYIVDANAQNLERIRRSVDDKLTSSID